MGCALQMDYVTDILTEYVGTSTKLLATTKSKVSAHP